MEESNKTYTVHLTVTARFICVVDTPHGEEMAFKRAKALFMDVAPPNFTSIEIDETDIEEWE